MDAQQIFQRIQAIDSELREHLSEQGRWDADFAAAQAAAEHAALEYQPIQDAADIFLRAEKSVRAAETRLQNARARLAAADRVFRNLELGGHADERLVQLQESEVRVDGLQSRGRHIGDTISHLQSERAYHLPFLQRTHAFAVLTSRDLLSRILRFAHAAAFDDTAEDNDQATVAVTRVDFPAQAIALVSSLWRRTAPGLDSQRSCIKITLGTTLPNLAIRRLANALARPARTDAAAASPPPLRIRVNRRAHATHAHRAIIQLVTLELDRVSSLVLDFSSISSPDDPMLALGSTPAPMLESLRFFIRGHMQLPLPDLFTQRVAPALRSIQVQGSDPSLPAFLQRLLPACSSELHDVVLDGIHHGRGVLLRALDSAPSIRTLTIRNTTIRSDFFRSLGSNAHICPRLETLRLTAVEPEAGDVFDHPSMQAFKHTRARLHVYTERCEALLARRDVGVHQYFEHALSQPSTLTLRVVQHPPPVRPPSPTPPPTPAPRTAWGQHARA